MFHLILLGFFLLGLALAIMAVKPNKVEEEKMFTTNSQGQTRVNLTKLMQLPQVKEHFKQMDELVRRQNK